MGGPGATTTVIQQVKKTEADVKKDLFNNVVKNAREQLKTVSLAFFLSFPPLFISNLYVEHG